MLGLPKQWLAVRKYGVPSLAVLLINDLRGKSAVYDQRDRPFHLPIRPF